MKVKAMPMPYTYLVPRLAWIVTIGAVAASPAAYAHADVNINVTGSITPGTCSPLSVAIPIDDVSVSSLTHVGDTSAKTPEYGLNLTCSGSPSVIMTVTGKDSGNSAYPHLFGIELGNQAAKGIAVELMLNGGEKTLYPNTPITITNAAATSVTIPISARYVRIGDISPGAANAIMEATFSYK